MPDRPLCPDCTLNIEPSNLIVDRLYCCTATRTDVDANDPRALGLGVERDLRLIEAGYQGPFQWRRSWGSKRTRGFAAETGLQLVASVQAIQYVDQEPAPDPSNTLLCPQFTCDDYLEFGIHVEMATDDGAIRGGGDLLATAYGSPLVVRGGAALPIATFSGQLDLGSLDVQPHSGGVLTAFEFSELGVQGYLFPWLGQYPEYPDFDPPQRDTGPVMGQWPVPTCVGRGLPLDVDVPLETWPGGTARHLFAQVTAELEAAAAAPATWSDGTTTEVAMHVVGQIDHACRDTPTRIHVTVPLQLQTSDRRIDQVFPAEFGIAWDAGETQLVWGWYTQSEVLDTASIQRIVGPIGQGMKAEEARVEATGQLQHGSWSIIEKSGSPLRSKHLQW